MGGALVLAGCGRRSVPAARSSGSTLRSSYRDPDRTGVLAVGPGVPLIDRTELAPRKASEGVLCTIAHLTDAHVLDSQSPARVPFLRRLGAPFNSTFRPQEVLSTNVLRGALRSIDALHPDAVIQGGDLIDNAQSNELAWAVTVLGGGRVRPDSGARGYEGVQSAGDPDPLYYRPDVDAPLHPGLLRDATRPLTSPGLAAPWFPVLGDHDILVQGVLRPSSLTRAIALGSRAVWDLPTDLRIPADLSDATVAISSSASPDALPMPAPINALIEQLSTARAVNVTPDGARRELDAGEVLGSLRQSSGSGGNGELMDYSFDVGPRVRVIVLDLVRREGGSGGLVHPGQERWLAGELHRAAGRWVLVASHQPLTSTTGADRLLALLDRDPHVLAAIWGHTHRNRIVARETPAGGYWLIATCSLIDYPQQTRALRICETEGAGAVIETWMLDHVPDPVIGDVARELSYLDAQGGRPQGFEGSPLDRNVRLYKR
jgi:hypothetical protein